MLTEKAISFIEQQQFLHVGTSTLEGIPTVAPKPVLKIEKNRVFLVDYLYGRTYENIKVNPVVCLAAIDTDGVIGYILRGKVSIIDKGRQYTKLARELSRKQVRFATQSVINVVRGKEQQKTLPLVSMKAVCFFEVVFEEVVKVESTGALQRERVILKEKRGH